MLNFQRAARTVRSFSETDSETEIIQRLIENFIDKISEEMSELKKTQSIIYRNQKRIMDHIDVSEFSDEEGEEELEEEKEVSSESSSEDPKNQIKAGDPVKLQSEIRELSEEDRSSQKKNSWLNTQQKEEESSVDASLKIPSQGPDDSQEFN